MEAKEEGGVIDLPVVWANYISIAGFVFLGLLVWVITKPLIYIDASDQAKWRDIRVWATVLIVFQVTLYMMFT